MYTYIFLVSKNTVSNFSLIIASLQETIRDQGLSNFCRTMNPNTNLLPISTDRLHTDLDLLRNLIDKSEFFS